MAIAKTIAAAQLNVNEYMVHVIRRIESLSLKVAAEKTDAVLFYGRKKPKCANPFIQIKGKLVCVSPFIKYLDVMLDSRFIFRPYFKYIDKEMEKVTKVLGRLMSNLRGPHKKKRRLYANIIAFVVTYAAPIWNSLVVQSDAECSVDSSEQSLYVCAAYRSVSFNSTLLARLVPLELLAAEHARIFWRIQDAKRVGNVTPSVISDIKISESVLTR